MMLEITEVNEKPEVRKERRGKGEKGKPEKTIQIKEIDGCNGSCL